LNVGDRLLLNPVIGDSLSLVDKNNVGPRISILGSLYFTDQQFTIND